MKNEIYLFIETSVGNLAIPFKRLRNLDELTVRYKDNHDLVFNLMNALGIQIDESLIRDVYVYYHYSKKDKETGKIDEGSYQLPIKYSEDNYDLDSVEYMYGKYLIDDKSRIKKSKVKYVSYEPLQNFIKNNKPISDSDIVFSAHLYLLSDYRKNRDIYFMLKYVGYKVKIKKVKPRKAVLGDRSINGLSSSNDYFANLIARVKNNPEEYDKVMEEIAGYDLEDISKLIDGESKIVDGIIDSSKISNLDIYELASLAELKPEELLIIASPFQKNNGRKR